MTTNLLLPSVKLFFLILNYLSSSLFSLFQILSILCLKLLFVTLFILDNFIYENEVCFISKYTISGFT